MSPKSGEEVFLTDRETQILSIFVKVKELDDKIIADQLVVLADKLIGRHK